jgi:hypothetical protein
MSTIQNKTIDIDISQVTGLETYKGLYYFYPNLYSYISDPLQPTEYFKKLVSQVIINTGLSFAEAGIEIQSNLESIAKGNEPQNLRMVQDLIDSSYAVKNMNRTTMETIILVTLVVFISFWIIWYLYNVKFFEYIFNMQDGIACYNCPSIFDKI